MLAVLSLLTPLAVAQDAERFDAHGLRFAPGLNRLSDGLVTWRPDVGRAGSFAGTVMVDYADQTLVQVTEASDGTISEQALMQNLLGATAMFRAALHSRVGMAVELPVQVASTRLGEAQSVALRDARLAVPVELFDSDGLQVGVIPFVDIPLGGADQLLSAGFGAGGKAALAAEAGRFDFAANLGASVHPGTQLFNLTGGPRLLASVAGAARVTDTLAFQLELDSRAGTQSDGPSSLDIPAEVLGSARWAPPRGPSVVLGGATHLTNGAGSARIRVFLGVSMGIDQGRDFDADGLADRDDSCVSEPEVFNGWRDGDGCPDALAAVSLLVRDPEGVPLAGVELRSDDEVLGTTNDDGRLLLDGRMPETRMNVVATVPEGSRFRDPEPVALTLGEGDNEAELAFAYRPGTFRVVILDEEGNRTSAEITFRGASELPPVAVGPDGEALVELPPGKWSLVIESGEHGLASQEIVFGGADEESFEEVTFRMKAREVATTREEVVVLQAVSFQKDSDELDSGSMALLDEVGANLLKHDKLRRIEVQGHTSAEGSPDYNLDLSQRRMDSVVRYLVGRGVDAGRLTAVGYGEVCPLAPNTTEANRAENRRVQFIVLDPAPERGVPCHDGNPARRAEALVVSPE